MQQCQKLNQCLKPKTKIQEVASSNNTNGNDNNNHNRNYNYIYYNSIDNNNNSNYYLSYYINSHTNINNANENSDIDNNRILKQHNLRMLPLSDEMNKDGQRSSTEL